MICFERTCTETAGAPDGPRKFSAYCAEHEYVAPEWQVDIKGKKQCQCAACHEVFTTTRTFDSHQTLKGGRVVCKDPKRMFTADRRRALMLTSRGWAKNPDLEGFNTFTRSYR